MGHSEYLKLKEIRIKNPNDTDFGAKIALLIREYEIKNEKRR